MDWKLEPITVKDTHEPIIERSVWEHIQKILTGRGSATKHPRAVSSDYLFSGLMECGSCQAKFVGVSAHSGGRRYRYYMCNIPIGSSLLPRTSDASPYVRRTT